MTKRVYTVKKKKKKVYEMCDRYCKIFSTTYIRRINNTYVYVYTFLTSDKCTEQTTL